MLFGASAHYNFPIGTPSSEQIKTARNYTERRLNKRREKQLIENERRLLIERQLNKRREKELIEKQKRASGLNVKKSKS